MLSECQWMKQHGHRPLLVAPKRSQIYARAKSADLNVFPMSFSNLTAVVDYFRLRGFLRKNAPDVFNTHGNMDAKVGLMAARGLGIPCVIRSRHHSHPVSAFVAQQMDVPQAQRLYFYFRSGHFGPDCKGSGG